VGAAAPCLFSAWRPGIGTLPPHEIDVEKNDFYMLSVYKQANLQSHFKP